MIIKYCNSKIRMHVLIKEEMVTGIRKVTVPEQANRRD